MKGGLEVRVVGTTVVRLVATPPIAAKILPGAAGPVLMLVGSAAGLLAGDAVHLRVDLGPGSRLTVRTTAATIAHPCRHGGSTSLEVDCRLAEGARLAWLPEPLIACADCRHHGRSRLILGPGAVVTWLDMVALGRTGESPGHLEQRLDVELEGRPLLREGLRVGGAAGWDGPAVLGGHRHVAALHLLGRRLAPEAANAADACRAAGVMQLAGPGTTARFVAHGGEELSRQVASLLRLFLPFTDPARSSSAPAGHSAQEALHV